MRVRKIDRMEEQLVLVHLRAGSGTDGSGTDACGSVVHIGCIAAEAPYCHMFFNPHEAPSNAHDSVPGMTRSKSVGRIRKHAVAPAP